MTSEEDSKPNFVHRNEPKLAAAILGAFLLIGFLVATRSPSLFVDEPEFTDPAANLALGRGFTSTLWGQPRDVLWTGNAPVFPLILGLWLKAVGFGFFQARIFDPLLAATGAFLIWAGLKKSQFIKQPSLRLLCLGLVLSGSIITVSFRTIRPDTTMFVLSSGVFFACCLGNKLWNYGLAALFAAPLVPSGLQLGPYFGVMGLLALILFGRKFLPSLFAIGVGMVVGTGIMFLVFSHFSVWKTFLGEVLPLTSASIVHQDSFVHSKIFGSPTEVGSLFTIIFGDPRVLLDQRILFDHSNALLFFSLCLLGVVGWKTAAATERRLFLFTALLALTVPAALHIAGHYFSFYRWMTYVPLCIAATRLLEVHLRSRGPDWAPKLVFATMGLSLLLGVPLRTAAALASWSNRSMQPLMVAAQAVAKPDDVALVDFRAYFALRTHTQLLYAYGITARGDFSRIPDLPTNQISLLCLYPGELEVITNRIGGEWEKIPPEKIPDADAMAKTRYPMEFYRRRTVP